MLQINIVITPVWLPYYEWLVSFPGFHIYPDETPPENVSTEFWASEKPQHGKNKRIQYSLR
jgi:hypothetical protein